MSNFDTTSISQGGLKLYFNTDVLSDDALKARVASEVKSLGALVEPDFAKQVMEGKGLTLRRIYCYELALCCDVTVTNHLHYTQWETYETGNRIISTTSSGSIKVEPEKKGYFATHDYDNTNIHKDTLVGMKCMIYPDSKFNTIIGQSSTELAWAEELLSGNSKTYSTQARAEYMGASAYFENLPSEKIMDAFQSRRAFRTKDFRKASIDKYYPEKSVARIGVDKYYIYVSYKGNNYNIELNEKGTIVLEKSTYPAQATLFDVLEKEEVYQLFLDKIKSEGDRVESEYLSFISDPKNVEIEPCFNSRYIYRVRLDLDASSSYTRYTKDNAVTEKENISTYLGKYFSNYNKAIIPVNEVLSSATKFKPYSNYKYQNSNATTLFKVTKEVTKKDFTKEQTELSLHFDVAATSSFSLKKGDFETCTCFVEALYYTIKVNYHGDSFCTILYPNGLTSSYNERWICEYKQSQKQILENINRLKKKIKSPVQSFIIPFFTIVLMLLSIWQAISLWALDRYDFIQSGNQSLVINIFTIARLITIIVSLCLLVKYITSRVKGSLLIKKHSLGKLLDNKECMKILDLSLFLSSTPSFAWSIIGTLVFLVPFIIFIFV